MNGRPFGGSSSALQINPSSSPFIFPRQTITTSGIDPALYLPSVGPYQNLARPLVSSLSDITYNSTTLTGAGTTDSNILKKKTITLNVGQSLFSSTYCFHLWCDKLVFSSGAVIYSSGDNGGSATPFGCCVSPQSGVGGNGGSGGGGGATGLTSQATGGQGGNGQDGSAGGHDCGSVGGAGGLGYGRSTISAYPTLTVTGPSGVFSYGIGGNSSFGCGGSIAPTGPWGMGAPGGDANNPPLDYQPGGGAGSGYQILVANEIVGAGYLTGCGVNATGGSPGGGVCGSDAGFGGSGNIHIFAKKYVGNSIGGFGFATLYMYEVAHDGVTILNTFTQDAGHSWDHL